MLRLFQHLSPTYKYSTRFMSIYDRTPTSKTVQLLDRPFVLDSGALTRRPLQLHYWEWLGRKPTVIFCHAASFHGRCYDSIIEYALPNSHVISIDLRGHGRSEKHNSPYSFRWFGEDLADLIEKLDLENVVGVGHSVGGYALVLAACKFIQKGEKKRFSSLLLLDPVIFPHEMYTNENSQEYKNVAATFEPHRRRKSQWSSVDDMMRYFARREPFSRWPTSVLRDYCLHAVDNDFRLLCSPNTEVSIYHNCIHESAQIYDDIRRSNCLHDISIHVARCSKPCISPISIEASFTAPKLAKCFAKGYDTVLENTSHLFPMETPHLVTKLLKDII
ncbi:unnamed protein product [Rotaria magnacalcarata]|uniref:AB hydrolase-1 domain-containing protein n=2 Tax=Rotaria magnacalcarata TaxID=392030 RepID=A0A815XKH8_9BILA|nr:unnamed protein product [Rotaria magnacalcarata]CAF4052526.1 unnamed protein product [Rotaria magnacalcarata]